jgi:hypothetical protein
VKLLAPYEMPFSVVLGSLGRCLVVFLTCLLVGGLVGKLGVLCLEESTFQSLVVSLDGKKLHKF